MAVSVHSYLISKMLKKLFNVMGNKKKGQLIEIYGKNYAFNLERVREVCLMNSESGGTIQQEISQVYDRQDDGEYMLSSKAEHETKIIGNAQNDMIIYDIVKLFIVTLLDNDLTNEDGIDLGTALALNTMIDWGLLYEVE